MDDGVEIQGECQPRFKSVRDVFEASFSKGEVGAGVSVYLDGEPVVDLWGGHADAASERPWERDTIVNTYSTTKGMTAICAHRLVERRALDLDAPVAGYWPEFAQGGKADLPVRYLLSHQAGLPAIRRTLPTEARFDWDALTSALAEQEPWWKPGTKHGYHAFTFGHLVGEVVRRIDGRTLGTYFREEVAEPLGADFRIGFGPEHDARCADMIPAPEGPQASEFRRRMEQSDSVMARAFSNPPRLTADVNSREWRAAEIPAANGHGTARALARIYGALAQGGDLDGVHVLSAEAIERANTEQARGIDEVLAPLETRFGLGFFMTQPAIPFGPNPRAFGHPGAGGSLGFADPDAGLGFGYVMNQMQNAIVGSSHGAALIQAVYESLS